MNVRPALLRVLALLVLASGAPRSAESQSQARELHWRSLEVEAHLDLNGRLDVRERQVMVFSGDWNGGERTFRLRWDQKLEFLGIQREDASAHTVIELTRGDIDEVDHYDWTDSRTLRWRSRLPEDPPFENTEIVYVLHYRLSNILLSDGGNRYRLDHDFAFPDREGPIEAFSLDLSFDSLWKVPPDFEGRQTRGPLAPGESAVFTIPLSYEGAGRPGAVRSSAPGWSRSLLAAAFLAGLGAIAALFYVQENRIGRFLPLTDPRTIDETWLRENVFSMFPEEVGAAWDNTTAAPEVAAVLARMVAEGKLSSEVYTKKGFFSSQRNLRLKLRVEKSTLSGYERTLVNSLFFSGKETDTEKIRAHYEGSGFDPSSKIEGPLKQRVKAILRSQKSREISKRPTLTLLAASIVMLAVVAVIQLSELFVLLPAFLVSLILYVLILIPAVLYRRRVERLGRYALTFLVPIAIIAWSALHTISVNPDALGFPALLALALFLLALFTSLFNLAKFRDGETALRVRKMLASARRYFREELSRRDPRLKDEWFPYLLAFGLGTDVDRWFRSFGGAATTSSFGSDTSTSSFSGSTSSGGGSSSWTGGGGAFGGAGATGSWVAAVGSVAAGVAAPSSSGSSGGGGGGGGGGSSGGGGGGGW